MSKQHNMGRGSHLAQEAELQQNLPQANEDIGDQPTRPTTHGHHIDRKSKKEPPIKPSHSQPPHRVM